MKLAQQSVERALAAATGPRPAVAAFVLVAWEEAWVPKGCFRVSVNIGDYTLV